jgi:hypothetical protein
MILKITKTVKCENVSIWIQKTSDMIILKSISWKKNIKVPFLQGLSYLLFWVQDQVPPFPSETALAIVEEELGASVGDIFDQFDYEPIAAASLGNQCYTLFIFLLVCSINIKIITNCRI